MEKATLFSNLKVVNLKPRLKSFNKLSGVSKSNAKGRGMSFSEVREYQIGDEVRTIDWNVTARYNTPHVKIFEEEKESHFLLVLDASSSSLFANQHISKWEKQVEIAAILAFSAWKNNDYFSLLVFSDKIDLHIPFAKGRQHFYFAVNKLLSFQPQRSQTNLDLTFDWIREHKLPKSTILLISDFLTAIDFKEKLQSTLSRHIIALICVRHEDEEVLPDAGWIQAENFETGNKTWINTSNKETRHIYAKYYENNAQQLESISAECGVTFNKIKTNSNSFKFLNSIFS